MSRILVLRSGSEGVPGGEAGDVDVLVTHDIRARDEGIAEARRFEARDAILVVSSGTTLRVLAEVGEASLVGRPFRRVLAAGDETARALRAAAAEPEVPKTPGAAGILELLGEPLTEERILWPRAADADEEPLQTLRARGAAVSAPAVYEKKPRDVTGEPAFESFLRGAHSAVAVGSVAGLDVFLAALAAQGVTLSPWLRWGVLGPESASALRRRGLPPPVVPERPRMAELVERLRLSG
ncbi:MAG TPA: uroporphyrinogen-III synthase [Thermoanaerobaculia bacterium]|nr:uroporphyrinogen-III synthase [Thermoanaerobaculia bacterium]